MCPSMADTDFYTTKPQKIVSADHANSSKYFHQFLFKAIIVTIFLVILPLLPSQAPEFINQNLHARSWELLQLIFVGIAVSYGLFSKRNDEIDKEHYSKLDNAQSYVSRLLQVSSVFDDETENPSSPSDANKVQTWNSQYYRGEPMVMVAKEKSILEKQNAATARIDEKPLLLPVRSLKSRVSEPDESETSPEPGVKTGSVSRSNSSLGSKRFSSNSRKSRNGEGAGASQAKMEENIEESVVHRSPIPWRSRSGRLEMKEDEDVLLPSYPQQPPKMEDPEPKRLESRSLRSQSFRLPKTNSVCPSPNKPSPPTTPSSPKIQSPLPYFPSESQAKSVEDVVRKKVYYKSSPPPPPPPPPTFLHKSLMKSKSSLSNERDYPQKEMKRSIRSVPNDFSETEIEDLLGDDVPLLGKSVRTIRQSEPVTKSVTTREFDENIIERRRITDKMMHMNTPTFKRQTFTEFPEEEKKEVIEKILMETDDEDSLTESEDDYFEEGLGSSGTEELANANAPAPAPAEEGPDVDKKADEFIAKFREQIRLQRIESIRRSAGQLARNRAR